MIDRPGCCTAGTGRTVRDVRLGIPIVGAGAGVELVAVHLDVKAGSEAGDHATRDLELPDHPSINDGGGDEEGCEKGKSLRELHGWCNKGSKQG